MQSSVLVVFLDYSSSADSASTAICTLQNFPNSHEPRVGRLRLSESDPDACWYMTHTSSRSWDGFVAQAGLPYEAGLLGQCSYSIIDRKRKFLEYYQKARSESLHARNIRSG